MALCFGGDWNESLKDDHPLCFGGDWLESCEDYEKEEEMTEKFTPGVWEIEEQQAHCKGFEFYRFAILTETKRICMCQTDDPENIPQMQANAALIAAAPAMYALLKLMTEPTFMGSMLPQELRSTAEQILKKARGEE